MAVKRHARRLGSPNHRLCSDYLVRKSPRTIYIDWELELDAGFLPPLEDLDTPVDAGPNHSFVGVLELEAAPLPPLEHLQVPVAAGPVHSFVGILKLEP